MRLPRFAQTAKNLLWGHWLVRIFFFAWALIAGYDTFSGVLGQITPWSPWPIRQLFGLAMTTGSHLLPWWGWLLVLQGLVLFAIIDYLSRLPVRTVAAEAPEIEPPAPQPSEEEREAARVAAAEKRRAIFKEWSKASSFEIQQAAFLWTGRIPAALFVIAPDDVRAVSERLIAAVHDGTLESDAQPKVIGKGFFLVSEKTRVKRDALIQWATSQNEIPSFLR